MKLTQVIHSKTHRALVFGAPKSGKTQLVSELSAYYNLLWFDLENGWETLLKLPAAQQERVDLIQIPDTKNYPIAIETVLKVISGNLVSICQEHGKVSCPLCKKDSKPFSEVQLNALGSDVIVVFDSITQLANSAMNHLTKGQPDTYKPEWTDYRNQGALMEKFLSELQQAKYNVVCITHEAEVEMEDGRKKLVPVAGTTNFSRNTAKYFDHVIYAEIKNKGHKFASSTCYANNILTGSRTDVELEKSNEPSLMDIFTLEVAANNSKTLAESPGQIAASRLQNLHKGIK